MTVNYISSESFLTANPTITVPVNCNCLVVLSYSANALTIGGNTPVTKATMDNYNCKIFELMNPPAGSQAVAAVGDVVRIFVYLNDAASCSILFNDYAADGVLSGTLTSVLTSELVLLMTYDETQYFEFELKLNSAYVENIVYFNVYIHSAYKLGLGADMTFYARAPQKDEIPVVYGKCALVIAKFGTSDISSQSNYVTFI